MVVILVIGAMVGEWAAWPVLFDQDFNALVAIDHVDQVPLEAGANRFLEGFDGGNAAWRDLPCQSVAGVQESEGNREIDPGHPGADVRDANPQLRRLALSAAWPLRDDLDRLSLPRARWARLPLRDEFRVEGVQEQPGLISGNLVVLQQPE